MTDAIVMIGAGHNGLTCAAYLAQAGKSVTVLEASERIGGAAITRPFGAKGFRVSAGAHLLHLLDPQVERDMALAGHGLRFAQTDVPAVALAADGDHLVIDRDGVRGGQVQASDQQAFLAYRARMLRFAKLLHSLYRKPPPPLAVTGPGSLFELARIGFRLRRLGKREMREFMRIFGINIFDVLEENFEHPLLKGALALDAVLGNQLGPRSNNTVFNALHRMTGSVAGKAGAFGQPIGGMGAVSAALGSAARAAGVTLRTGSPVARILLEGDRVRGVELESGEQIAATRVVSNADPKTTLLDLLGARHLEAGLAARANRIRSRGNAAKLHLALSGAPRFRGLDSELQGARLLVAPDPHYIERAFNHCKYGRYSEHPALEITLPSVADDSLAPAGQHVLSAVVQYAPYELKESWDSEHDNFKRRLIELIEHYAPGISDQIVASELLTPADIEREFRIEGGHWHHGELTLDQAFMLRPVPGASQYQTPISGLFLCGAGCHPGGGVMGSAGRLAAKAVIKAESTS